MEESKQACEIFEQKSFSEESFGEASPSPGNE